ncbi:CD1375 family protein [Carnobacterium divergens]|nr:CD1375 family protein [Carnobacterium divergens]
MLSNLIELYANHVIEGKRTLKQVPTSIRDEVEKIVNKKEGE